MTTGRNTGEAYVIVETENDQAEAMKFQKQNIGSRYIDLYRSSAQEFSMSCMWFFFFFMFFIFIFTAQRSEEKKEQKYQNNQ